MITETIYKECLQLFNGCLDNLYGKYPKILNTKVSDKMPYANSADPDQTATEEAVKSGSTLFVIPLSILRNNCVKSKI